MSPASTAQVDPSSVAVVVAVVAAWLREQAVLGRTADGRRGGRDSPWPTDRALRPTLRALQRELRGARRQMELMEQSAEGYEDWQTCSSIRPVNEPAIETGVATSSTTTATGTVSDTWMRCAVDRRRRTQGQEDVPVHALPRWRLPERQSPNPAERPSRARYRQRALRPRPSSGTCERCSSDGESPAAAAQRLETVSERFDEWESCVSWVPVTELGDPDASSATCTAQVRRPSYGRRCTSTAPTLGYPDYMFLALVGGERPGALVRTNPEKGVD